jgi:hypothetical protein
MQMRSSRSGVRHLVVIASGVFIFLGLIVVVLWGNDVRKDRTHSVTVEAATPLFPGTGRNCDASQRATIVQQGIVLPVRRIRYWKDCATIDVDVRDGESGHFVLGVGSLNVQPPLP